MNSLQRLLSNTALSFFSSILIKASNSLLFIFIGRELGPTDAGIFNLGITFYTIVFALSAWGLQELLVREVAPKREESGRYLVNYLAIRLFLTAAVYGLMLLCLYWFLPYSPLTKIVIQILALAVFPEAIFSLLQALFEAYENLFPPTLAAAVTSAFKLGIGLWLLFSGADVLAVVWVVPLGSILSVLILLPFVRRLYRQSEMVPGRLDWAFIRWQLSYTPSFVVIHLFALLDYQTDTFLISLFLSETEVGWYGAAQTILLAFWMLPTAIRAAIYPLMSRYQQQDVAKLKTLYKKSSQYLIIAVLPVVVGVYIVAPDLIMLIFGEAFAPAVPALRWSIWAVIFALCNVPSARLMIVYNRQREAAWLTGLSMSVNVVLNLLLIPHYGIVGAAMARTGATFVFFLSIYWYVQTRIMSESLLPLVIRPLLATLIMFLIAWQFTQYGLFLTTIIGIATYTAAAILLKIVPAEDRLYWQTVYRLPQEPHIKE